MGRSLIPEMLGRGHSVRALARRGAEAKLPEGCTCLVGDPLDGALSAIENPPDGIKILTVPEIKAAAL